MHRTKVGRVVLVALACLVVFPLAASAQGMLAGLVRDESAGCCQG